MLSPGASDASMRHTTHDDGEGSDEVQISHQYFPYKAVTERAAASSEETHELRWRSAEVVGVPASRPCNLY